MSTHNICFYREIRKIINEYSSLTFCMLGKKFSRGHFEIFFLVFLENRI